jgi:PIN domain nuclease of toxin-antitoxin system
MADFFLLDTHCWVWLVSGAEGNFGRKSLKAIERACTRGECLVSVMSVWELGMLAAKGRLRMRLPVEQWVRQALELPGLHLEPLSLEAALGACSLPFDFHGDPVDRWLVATARHLQATFVTSDEKLLRYGKYCMLLPA